MWGIVDLTSFADDLRRIMLIKDSRPLTFDIEHIFKTMQLLKIEKYVSRATLCRELQLGEGSVKTIISHMKKSGCVDSIKSGTFLLEKGHKLIDQISQHLPAEIKFNETKYLPLFNHAILLKDGAHCVVDCMQQRDFAIRKGAQTALTILYQKGQFLLAIKEKPYLMDDEKLERNLAKLCPEDEDVMIITSANSKIVAEMAAKSSALYTLQNTHVMNSRILF
jgi:biotin operon repressor